MAFIKIPSSNIYGFGDSNSLLAKNKITQTQLLVNTFKKQIGSISAKLGATYYLWDEEEEVGLDNPKLVAEDITFNSLEFTVVNLSTDTTSMLGVVGTEEASVKIEKPIDITELAPNTDGFVKGYNVIRTQNILYIEYNSQDNIQQIKRETKVITDSPKIKYNHKDNTFSFGVELERPAPDGVRDATIIYHQYSTGEIPIVDYYLLSESIEVQGLHYYPQESTHKQGDSESAPISLPSNELVQEGSTLNYDVNLSENLLKSVLDRYSNGKEVYEIKCSIAKYNSTIGELVIDPTDERYVATFKKHDKIIPYVYTTKGEVPLSTDLDELPKQFEVVGVDFEDSGVVWQKLTIQEVETFKFTINDMVYIAEANMTWKDFENSIYNEQLGLSIVKGYVVLEDISASMYKALAYNPLGGDTNASHLVKGTATINPSANYVTIDTELPNDAIINFAVKYNNYTVYTSTIDAETTWKKWIDEKSPSFEYDGQTFIFDYYGDNGAIFFKDDTGWEMGYYLVDDGVEGTNNVTASQEIQPGTYYIV